MHDKTYMLLLDGFFFNMDALKNHLKIKKCIFVVYKDIVCELKQNTSLFFVKIMEVRKLKCPRNKIPRDY